MWRHTLTMAVRGFLRHKLYSFINIAGLSIGLAAAVLIALYVRDQLSYDTWVPGAGNLYRLELTFRFPGREPMRLASVPFVAVSAAGAQLAGVKATTHIAPEQMTVVVGDRQFRETVSVVDPDFLRVVRLPLAQGDPAHVLAQPESVVLSASSAHKYFGNADPIGKVLTVSPQRNESCKPTDSACLGTRYSLTVTGVLRDLPHNTQLVADLLVPNTSRADCMSAAEKTGDWTGTDGDYGYLELTPGTHPAAITAGLSRIMDRAVDLGRFGIHLPASAILQFRLTPFRDVHLTSDRYGGMKPAGSRSTVYGLAMVALLIVLVACFNFTNLATARATLRLREIAVRKLGGAKRRQLVAQLLGEAVVTALVSLALALSLVEVLLPAYDRFLDAPIRFHYPADWGLLAALVLGAMAVGLVSGSYPAFVLSSLRPASGLKPGAAGPAGPGRLRSALVVAQFGVSIGLGIAAAVMFRQISFVRSDDLGFHRDGVVVIQGLSKLTVPRRVSLAMALSTDPDVVAVALSNVVPFNMSSASNLPIQIEGQPQSFTSHIIAMTPSFTTLYDMHLVAGRFLSAAHGEDLAAGLQVHNILINAAAASRFGLSPQQSLGRKISVTINGLHVMTVVGVVRDTMFDGIKDAIQPTVYYADTVDSDTTTFLSVRVRAGRLARVLPLIDTTWRAFAPGTAIDRYLLNDAFDGLFRSDEKEGAILGAFVIIAILIGCLGLFGLAVFTAERRTKEIGIRKVSGARTADIVLLMLWRISLPVLLANGIAWPLAWYYLHQWLAGYTHRIVLSPLYFLAAGVIALGIACATVYGNTVRLARAHPVSALRYE
jgi:putative ABC transport system permease protein